jgi:hypothetical protein
VQKGKENKINILKGVRLIQMLIPAIVKKDEILDAFKRYY